MICFICNEFAYSYISLSRFLYLYLTWNNLVRTAIVRAGAEANNEAAHVLL